MGKQYDCVGRFRSGQIDGCEIPINGYRRVKKIQVITQNVELTL